MDSFRWIEGAVAVAILMETAFISGGHPGLAEPRFTPLKSAVSEVAFGLEFSPLIHFSEITSFQNFRIVSFATNSSLARSWILHLQSKKKSCLVVVQLSWPRVPSRYKGRFWSWSNCLPELFKSVRLETPRSGDPPREYPLPWLRYSKPDAAVRLRFGWILMDCWWIVGFWLPRYGSACF